MRRINALYFLLTFAHPLPVAPAPPRKEQEKNNRNADGEERGQSPASFCSFTLSLVELVNSAATSSLQVATSRLPPSSWPSAFWEKRVFPIHHSGCNLLEAGCGAHWDPCGGKVKSFSFGDLRGPPLLPLSVSHWGPVDAFRRIQGEVRGAVWVLSLMVQHLDLQSNQINVIWCAKLN